MEKKGFKKKLVLNKKTIATLNNGKMDGVKGGTGYTQVTCNTCLTPPGGSNCIACYQQYTTYGGCIGDCDTYTGPNCT